MNDKEIKICKDVVNVISKIQGIESYFLILYNASKDDCVIATLDGNEKEAFKHAVISEFYSDFITSIEQSNKTA